MNTADNIFSGQVVDDTAKTIDLHCEIIVDNKRIAAGTLSYRKTTNVSKPKPSKS
jgi:hypothetical protein